MGSRLAEDRGCWWLWKLLRWSEGRTGVSDGARVGAGRVLDGAVGWMDLLGAWCHRGHRPGSAGSCSTHGGGAQLAAGAIGASGVGADGGASGASGVGAVRGGSFGGRGLAHGCGAVHERHLPIELRVVG